MQPRPRQALAEVDVAAGPGESAPERRDAASPGVQGEVGPPVEAAVLEAHQARALEEGAGPGRPAQLAGVELGNGVEAGRAVDR